MIACLDRCGRHASYVAQLEASLARLPLKTFLLGHFPVAVRAAAFTTICAFHSLTALTGEMRDAAEHGSNGVAKGGFDHVMADELRPEKEGATKDTHVHFDRPVNIVSAKSRRPVLAYLQPHDFHCNGPCLVVPTTGLQPCNDDDLTNDTSRNGTVGTVSSYVFRCVELRYSQETQEEN